MMTMISVFARSDRCLEVHYEVAVSALSLEAVVIRLSSRANTVYSYYTFSLD